MKERETADWRSDAINLAFVMVAGMCAMFSFGASYGGHQYLIVGGLGLLIGTAVAYGGTLLRQAYWLVIAEGVVAYFLFGAAIVTSSSAIAGVLPGASSLSILGKMAINGWTGLLSTSPVVGNTQNLLVVPLLCGIACGLATALLALRARTYPLAVIPPVVLLIIGILFGTDTDASRLIPGGALAVVLFAWVSYQQRNRREADVGTDSKLRPVLAIGILAACGLLGVALAPQLPMAKNHLRYVLRDHVAPPFNIEQYPSPLSAYRSYALPTELRNTPLFVVSGAPRNTYLEIASLDAYNGIVFNVAQGSAGSTSSGNFATVGQPVSSQPCALPKDCRMSRIGIRILDYQGVWMPSAGIVRSVTFGGGDSSSLASAFRYNVATNGAVVSTGLSKGNSYSIETDVQAQPPSTDLKQAGVVQVFQPTPSDVPSEVHTVAEKLTVGASSDFAKAQDLAKGLAGEGAFSDGYGNQSPSLAGHYAYRIAQFLNLPQPVGDSEQYAATMALMARSLGLPARVELGVHLAKGGTETVLGKDVTAWVDVDFQGVGWYPFNPTPPSSAHVNVKNPPPTPSSANQAQYQPPAHPLANPAPLTANATGKGHSKNSSGSSLIRAVVEVAEVLAVVLLIGAVICGPALLILLLKSRRRSRRRHASTTSAQIAGGWTDLMDCANDAGTRFSSVATRREQAVMVGGAATAMAELANAATFGPLDPPPDDVDAFWKMVDEGISQLRDGLKFWRRLYVVLSLKSLRTDLASSVRLPEKLAR